MKPRITPADSPDPDAQATLDKGYRYNGDPLNAARTLARHPKLLKRFTLYAGLFLSDSILPDRDRELVTLRCAHRFDSDYYFGHHARLAAGLLSTEEVTRTAGPARAWDGWDRTLISAVDELADDGDLSDATWEVLAARYDDAQLLHLVMLVGFYRMTCLYVKAIGIEREPGITGWPAERTPAMNDAYRFHHVGITVSNIDRSYAFYRDVIGMRFWNQEVALGTAPSEGRVDEVAGDDKVVFSSLRSEAFDTLTANPGSEFKYVNLIAPQGFVLQLIQYTAAGGGTLELDHNRVGSPHMSFFVEDVAQAYADCTANPDVDVVSGIVDIGPNMRSFYVRDPDGVPVELLELHS